MSKGEVLAEPNLEADIVSKLERTVTAQAEVCAWMDYVHGLDFDQLMAVYPDAHRMRRDQLSPSPSMSARDSAIMTIETSIRTRIEDFIAKDGQERQIPILDLRGVGYADYAFEKMLEMQHHIDTEDGIAR